MAMISLKLVYQRITLNKISLAFFLFGVFHCFAQVIIQSFLYSLDLDNRTLVTSVIQNANIPRREIAWLTGNSKEFKLQLCTNIPFGMTNKFCTTIFDSRQGNITLPVPAGFRRSVDGAPSSSSIAQMATTAEPLFNSSGQSGVSMSMDDGSTLFLDNQCTRLLMYPYQIFKDFVREDGVLIGAQFWLLFTSFIVVICESRPHLAATLVARLLVTAWSAYSTWRSSQISHYISGLITGVNSPCGVNLFPTYFQTRIAYEISILAISSVGLLFNIFFFIKLLRLYNAQTLNSIGPPKELIQIYRFFLGFCVSLQLSLFFLVTAMALWINELMNGAIARISTSTSSGLYHALFIITTTLLLPWLSMGWYAVRHEVKRLMIAFLVLAFFFIASWAVMFYSLVFRWTFTSWPFFAAITVTAFAGAIVSCTFGIICWRNFNKGLAHYMYAEDMLSKLNFQPGMFSNSDKESSKRASIDSLRMLTAQETKYMVSTNAVDV